MPGSDEEGVVARDEESPLLAPAEGQPTFGAADASRTRKQKGMQTLKCASIRFRAPVGWP
jgi:hypothetical protein